MFAERPPAGRPNEGAKRCSASDAVASLQLPASTSGMRSVGFGVQLALAMTLGGCTSEAPYAPTRGNDDGAPARVADGGTGEGGAGAALADARADAGDADASSCTSATLGGPKAAPYPVVMGGQKAWSHDDGFNAGYFHTYDALDVGGAQDLPHKVHVFLPRDYDACDSGYPVLYMNDGQTAFWKGASGTPR